MGSYFRAVVFTSALLQGRTEALEQLERLARAGLKACMLDPSRGVESSSGAVTGSSVLVECVRCLEGADTSAQLDAVVAWASSHGVNQSEMLICCADAAEADDWSACAPARPAGEQHAGAASATNTAGSKHAHVVEITSSAAAEAAQHHEPASVIAQRMPRRVRLSALPRAIAHHALTCSASGQQAGDHHQAGGGQQGEQLSLPLVVVATHMKASREKDLASGGLLPLVPQDGVLFFGLEPGVPLPAQLPFHALLHKASDELQYHAVHGTPMFSSRVDELKEFLAAHPRVACVDPLSATAKVIDRTELSRVCEGLSEVDLVDLVASGSEPAGAQVRAPRCVTVSASASAPAAAGSSSSSSVTAVPDYTAMAQGALGSLGVGLPVMVKPVVACGTPDSHAMALCLTAQALPRALAAVRLPAVVQEYVNHGGLVYKAYVAGDKVTFTVRPSIPDLPNAASDPEAAAAVAPDGVLSFDSLKSLPTTLPGTSGVTPPGSAGDRHVQGQHDQRQGEGTGAGENTDAGAGAGASKRQKMDVSGQATARIQPGPPSQAALERMAACLRERLGLSLFGFDVVVARRCSGAGVGAPAGDDALQASDGCSGVDYVVIDVNYFPHYRGAVGMAEAFRHTIRAAVSKAQGGALSR